MTSVLDTALGFQLQLRRIDTPSWFGADFATVQLDVEFQTDDRLRLKVSGGTLAAVAVVNVCPVLKLLPNQCKFPCFINMQSSDLRQCAYTYTTAAVH